MHDGTTVGDRELQNEFASIVKAWKFQRIPKPGDVTEVIYPFILSPIMMECSLMEIPEERTAL